MWVDRLFAASPTTSAWDDSFRRAFFCLSCRTEGADGKKPPKLPAGGDMLRVKDYRLVFRNTMASVRKARSDGLHTNATEKRCLVSQR